MFGATIAADTVARGAPPIFVDLGGMTILIRGRRLGEAPVPARPIRPYADFSSHNAWGTDHFGFLYQGDLKTFCAELRVKGVTFPVELKKGVNGSLLCYVAAPDGVSIELMQRWLGSPGPGRAARSLPFRQISSNSSTSSRPSPRGSTPEHFPPHRVPLCARTEMGTVKLAHWLGSGPAAP